MTLKHDKKSYFLLVVRMLKKNQFVFIFNLFFRLHFFCFRLFRRDRPTIFQVCRPAFLHASTSLLAAAYSIACFTAKSLLSSKNSAALLLIENEENKNCIMALRTQGQSFLIYSNSKELYSCVTQAVVHSSVDPIRQKKKQSFFKDEEIPNLYSATANQINATFD